MTDLIETLPPTSGQLVATDGRTLPLRSTHLATSAGGGLARTRLVQRFGNPHAEPLAVTYQLPLPADAAVAGFSFTIGDRRVEGEIDGRQAARERFEEALAAGHSAALVEQDRTALFQQQIGNIPPGAEIVAELLVDQPLQWLGGGEWEFRFPTTVAPRYLGAGGCVPDAGRIAVDVADGGLPARLSLELRIDDALAAGGAPRSPSHTLQCKANGALVVQFADGAAAMDRDVVVRWPVGAPAVGVQVATARPAAGESHADRAYGLLTLVPPLVPGTAVPRDLTILIDTSGSMSGQPLAQAKAIVAELIAGLGEQDQLQMIEFSMQPRAWRPGPVSATGPMRREAQHWIQQLKANGGTEMHTAVLESLRSLRAEGQAQVLLVTDGLIGFEQKIVQALLQRAPRNCRFHVLGVGPATNRSLSCAAARAGRGAEVIVGLDEDPAVAARRLGLAMATPVVVDLEIAGPALLGVAPARLPDLFAGSPARLSLMLRPEGGDLTVRGRTASGAFAADLVVPATAPATGRPEIVSRCGREQVEDLEMQAAAIGSDHDVGMVIERVGRQFRLATRFTSWVAVSSEPTVDPQAPFRRERIPHELPQGLSAEGLGLRRAGPAVQAVGDVMLCLSPPAEMVCPAPAKSPAKSLVDRLFGRGKDDKGKAPKKRAAAQRTPARTATISRLRQDQFGVEWTSDGSPWELPDEVQLVWADGTIVTVRIDRARSTQSGQVDAGLVIRLVLPLPAAQPTNLPIALELPGGRFSLIPAPN